MNPAEITVAFDLPDNWDVRDLMACYSATTEALPPAREVRMGPRTYTEYLYLLHGPFDQGVQFQGVPVVMAPHTQRHSLVFVFDRGLRDLLSPSSYVPVWSVPDQEYVPYLTIGKQD